MLTPNAGLLPLLLPLLAGTTLACASPLAADETVADVFARVHTGVVTLRTVSRGPTVETYGLPVEQEGTGSGVLVSAKGDILTAAHVVQTAEEVLVEFYDGSTAPARIVSSDPLTDLAMVRLVEPVPEGMAIAELGDSDQARTGSQVFAVGAPLGISHTLTVGHVSARRITPSLVDAEERVEVIQTDAALNPGNSGGPLFNMQGQVLGIVSFISTVSGGSQGLGFAVSANTCRERFLERPPVWSGLEYVSLRGRYAQIFNVVEGQAALLVQRVVKDSPADRMGLRGGDIPAEIGGQAMLLGGDMILSIEGIGLGAKGANKAIRAHFETLKPEDDLKVIILRGGVRIELSSLWSEFL